MNKRMINIKKSQEQIEVGQNYFWLVGLNFNPELKEPDIIQKSYI
jgi:hypothetical protein